MVAIGTQQLNSGGVNVPLRASDISNVSSLVGREEVLSKLARDRPDLFETVVQAHIDRRVTNVLREMADHWEELLPPYQFPSTPSDKPMDKPKSTRGRKKGSTNISREYFWELYRCAVDGGNGVPRLLRPYMGTHLAARMTLGYRTFGRYLAKWGPPENYAPPRG
jgi:hypothetical protein